MTLNDPGGRVRITVSPALIGVVVVLAAQLGTTIWAAASFATRQEEHGRLIEESRLRLNGVESELSRRSAVVQQFYEVEKRVGKIESELIARNAEARQTTERLARIEVSIDGITVRLGEVSATLRELRQYLDSSKAETRREP